MVGKVEEQPAEVGAHLAEVEERVYYISDYYKQKQQMIHNKGL